MTATSDDGLGTHYLDTGPLFCLGGSQTIADLYDAAHLADARVVEAVVGEVRRRAAARTPPGDPDRRGGADRAARAAAKRYYKLLQTAVPRPDPVPAELAEVEADLLTRAQQKHPDKSFHPAEHRGESESIHAAEGSGDAFVFCDIDAGRVARARGVLTETFTDIASRLAHAQHEVKPKRIAKELQTLASNGIDIGGDVRSALDLRRPR